MGVPIGLRWATEEPALLVAWLRDSLGFHVAERTTGSPERLRFPHAVVEIGRRSSRQERPLDLFAGAAALPASSGHIHPNGIDDLLGVGWAVVDAERAAAVTASATTRGAESAPAALEPDELLGARCLRVGAVVFLEPSREGRLAASLARHGEGPVGIYLRVRTGGLDGLADRLAEAGEYARRSVGGPFGASLLLPGQPVAGPHLVACDGRDEPGTIWR